jgi:hypothetical protein
MGFNKMIVFNEIDKSEVYTNYNSHYHDDATYYQISKNDVPLCIYGVLERGNGIAEAFWILNSFNKKVLSKSFFLHLFKHAFSLEYKSLYTWTRCPRLIKVFDHFDKFGIEKIDSPFWDDDQTKTWYLKRL